MAANFAVLPKSSPFGRAGEEQSDETERVSLPPWGGQMQFTVTAPPVKMQFRNARRRF